MKLTPARAKDLQRRGIKVDMAKVVGDRMAEVKREKPAEQPEPAVKAEARPDNVTIKDLIELARANEANAGRLISINDAMVAALREIARPKAVREHVSTIHRDQRGNISRVVTVTKEV